MPNPNPKPEPVDFDQEVFAMIDEDRGDDSGTRYAHIESKGIKKKKETAKS